MKGLIALIAGLLLIAGSVQAQPPMTDVELDGQRAGFLSLAGFTFDFGVVARTDVNGQLALQTSLSFGPDGLETVRTLGNAAAFRAQGLAFSVADDGSVALTDATGATTVAQTLTADQVRNTVLNTASGRDVRQATALNLVLPNFAATQQAMAAERLASQITTAAQGGLVAGR